MTSRARVKKAIHFLGPDRIPHYLPDGFENDILWLWVPRPPERQPWRAHGDHERRLDEWGVAWERSDPASMGEAVEWPIADIAQHARYVFPDLNHPDYLEDSRERIAVNNRDANPRYCLGVLPFNSLHEAAHNLMGLQPLFMAYYEAPGELRAFLGRLAAEQRASIRAMASRGCDGIMLYDDWGLQDRLMISVELFDAFYLPLYTENWQLAHGLGMDVWLHSCGHTLALLPRLIDAGLDVIQMDQQENMGLERLDEVAGGRLAFWCPVDIQQTMAHGSAEDVANYVRRMMSTVGRHNGGLISMAYSSPEAVAHSEANRKAMCAAFREFGVYRS